MRAAAILGLGSSPRNLELFQKNSAAEWTLGLPASERDADAVLIFGGDGTVHRHLAAVVPLKLPVLVVPCGSGNDFARALGLRRVKDSLEAWRKFASGANNVRAIDLGVITAERGTTEAAPPRYFCCAAGVGLDGEIARRANRLPRWLRGHGGYVLSFLPALAEFNPVRAKILVGHHGQWEPKGEQRVFVAVFANALAYGGGMRVAPRALLDDGMLDVCIVRELDKFRLFCLFPSVYFGRHLQVPEVDYFQTGQARIETETPLDVYADGEFVCQTPVNVSVDACCLRVISGC
jgi:diacylglycerol kinase (ATP)